MENNMTITEQSRNVPKLRFPEFSDNWSIATLEQLTSRIGDGIHSTPKYDNNGNYYFINGNNLVNGKIKIFETTKKVEESEAKKYNKELSNRTILLSINGTIGNLAFYNNEKVMLGKSAAYLNIKNEIDKEFIYNVLKISKTQNFFLSELTGSTIKNLSLKTIRETKISIPTPPEQTKIANFLTAVDKRINLLQKKKAELEQYKKGVMQKLFSQEIRFKQDDGSDFPDWEEKKLGEVLFEHKKRNKGNIYEEVFSVSKSKGVINQIEHLGRSYSAESIEHYKLTFPNDIIYTKSPTSDFPFGLIKQNQTGRIGVLSPLYAVFRPITSSLGTILHNYFLSWVNTYNYLVPIVHKGAKNTMNINNDDFLNGAKIKLPIDSEEQQKIANFLSSIDKAIEKLEDQIEQSQNWKQGLLQKMFV